MNKLYAVASNIEGHPYVDLVYAESESDLMSQLDPEYEREVVEVTQRDMDGR